MKIVGLQVQSCGALRNFTLSNLPPDGIIVLHGPNEAGKSTLLNFIQFILFGTRESTLTQCSGSLSVLFGDSQLTWTIHRQRNGKKSQVAVSRPDNTVGTEADLSHLLQGTDDRLFRSVFAFGLKELQDFETLSQESIRERIFTAGLVGAAKSPRNVATELESQFDSLVRHRGDCAARSVCNKLQELCIQLDASRKSQARYAELQLHVNNLAVSQNGHEVKITGLRKKQGELKVLIEVWPLWEELQVIEHDLKKLPPSINIHQNSEIELTQLRTLVDNDEKELSKLRFRQNNVDRKREAIRFNPLLLEKHQAIESLYSQLAVVQERGNHIKKLELERKSEHEKYLDAIREIGNGLNEEQIVKVDVSFSEREKVRDWIPKLEDASNACVRVRAEYDNERRLITIAQDRLKEIDQNQSNEVNTRTLVQHESELSRLRAALAKLAQVVSEVQGWNRDTSRLESELSEVALGGDLPPWLPLTLFVVAFSMFGAVVWQVSLSAKIAGVCGVAGLIAFVAGVAIINTRRKLGVRIQDRRQRINAQLDAVRNECTLLNGKARQFEETIRDATLELRLQAPVTEEVLNKKDQELRSIREKSAMFDQRSDVLERARQELSSLQNREKVLSDAVIATETTLRAHEESWVQWKKKRNLPLALKPQSALDLFNFITRAQECVKKRSFIDPQLKQIRSENVEWDNSLRAICKELGIDLPNGTLLTEQCIELRTQCAHISGAKNALDNLNVEAETIERDIAEKTKERDLANKNIRELFSSVGANSEDNFNQILQRENLRQRKTLRRNDIIGQITGRFGIGQNADRLRQILSTGQCLEWRQSVSAIDSEIRQAETNRDQLLRDHTSASQQLAELRLSADIASRELEYGTYLTNLSRLLREWRMLKLAHGLIERTMQDCEQNRQPQILQDAQQWFSPITGGRYTRLLRDEKNEAVQVMNSAQQTLTLDQLSSGTAEQLYLSLRLGLVQEFSRQRERLPLIFDDILVNFDPKRARRVVECLNELSRKQKQQIFLFTCHPQIRDMISEVCPHCRVEELSECGLSS